MSQRAARSLPTEGDGHYEIVWWQAGHHDDATCRRTACATPAEAAQVLAWLAADPANSGFQCSWQESASFTQIPF